MDSEIYLPQSENFTGQWLKTSKRFYSKESKEKHVVFIGDIEAKAFTNNHNIHYISSDFSKAKESVLTLNKYDIANHSNIILVDIPLVIAELENFSSFAKKQTNCIVIYNKEKLTNNEAKFLKAFELVDEVANLEQTDPAWIIENAVDSKQRSKQNKLYSRSRNFRLVGKEKARDFSFLLKKVFDISIAALLILMLSPIFILIYIAVKLESKGPAFYSSLRAGEGYRIFKFYKFRSMIKDADKKMSDLAHLNQYAVSKDGPTFFKINDDPRITRVGRFLRNTSLDELPQLFNILIGDMSLVGNRPLPLYEAATLTTNEFVERFSAPAGITGFWQIKKRGKAEMSVKERVELDIAYARKASPVFDLYIIASTPMALFQKSDV